jgi:hypothetical protein
VKISDLREAKKVTAFTGDLFDVGDLMSYIKRHLPSNVIGIDNYSGEDRIFHLYRYEDSLSPTLARKIIVGFYIEEDKVNVKYLIYKRLFNIAIITNKHELLRFIKRLPTIIDRILKIETFKDSFFEKVIKYIEDLIEISEDDSLAVYNRGIFMEKEGFYMRSLFVWSVSKDFKSIAVSANVEFDGIVEKFTGIDMSDPEQFVKWIDMKLSSYIENYGLNFDADRDD